MKTEVVDTDANRSREAMLARTMDGRNTRRRIAFFIAVGCVAAAVHWSVVVALVNLRAWPPLLANVAGWLVAFTVSFSGHHFLTFRHHGTALLPAAMRFLAISGGGFVVNEAAYALLLDWSGQRYDLLLAAVLLSVAVITYWLSRHWAFLRNPEN